MKKSKAKRKPQTKAVKKKIVKKRAPAAQGIAKAKAKATVGKIVPTFALPSTGGKTVGLKDLEGKNVVIYFYPKDSTPGCTVEGQDFSRLHEGFRAENTEVFGVSRDSMKSHENFKAKQNYSIDLLSDENERLCTLFGVIKMKNMYGRQVRGIERSTFVIAADGTLVKEWRGVRVEGHAEEVLNFVKTLS